MNAGSSVCHSGDNKRSSRKGAKAVAFLGGRHVATYSVCRLTTKSPAHSVGHPAVPGLDAPNPRVMTTFGVCPATPGRKWIGTHGDVKTHMGLAAAYAVGRLAIPKKEIRIP